MAGDNGQRGSQWLRLFEIAIDLIDQLEAAVGPVDWSFGGGTAMMIQIGHRQSHDIDIFLNDAQLLGFLDPSKSQFRFDRVPIAYEGDGMRFVKLAFEEIGELDFIVSAPLTSAPFRI